MGSFVKVYSCVKSPATPLLIQCCSDTLVGKRILTTKLVEWLIYYVNKNIINIMNKFDINHYYIYAIDNNYPVVESTPRLDEVL